LQFGRPPKFVAREIVRDLEQFATIAEDLKQLTTA